MERVGDRSALALIISLGVEQRPYITSYIQRHKRKLVTKVQGVRENTPEGLEYKMFLTNDNNR